jgi:hypothetical protein
MKPTEDTTNTHRRFPHFVYAGNAIAKALKNHQILKPTNCTQCGTNYKIQAHHHNGYSNYLEVLWLCDKCHRQAHVIMRKNQRIKYKQPMLTPFQPLSYGT